MSEPILSPGIDPKDVVQGVKVIEEQANKLVGQVGKMSKAFDDFGDGIAKKSRPGLDALKQAMVGTVTEMVAQMEHLTTANDRMARDLVRASDKSVKSLKGVAEASKASVASQVSDQQALTRELSNAFATRERLRNTALALDVQSMTAQRAAVYGLQSNALGEVSKSSVYSADMAAMRAHYSEMEFAAKQHVEVLSEAGRLKIQYAHAQAAEARAAYAMDMASLSVYYKEQESTALAHAARMVEAEKLRFQNFNLQQSEARAAYATDMASLSAYYKAQEASALAHAAKMAEAEKLRFQNFNLQQSEAKAAYATDMASLSAYYRDQEATALAHAAKMMEIEKLRFRNFNLQQAEARAAYATDMASLRTYYKEQEASALAHAAKMAELENLRFQNFRLQQSEAKAAYATDMASLSAYYKAQEATALAHSAKMMEVTSRTAKVQMTQALASPSGSYSVSEGSNIGAVKELSAAHLVGAVSADKARKSNTELNATLRDGHSAARGLASGFGAMWLTWGNIVPLMAGAAISNALVKSVKAGAEFENTMRTLGELSGATSKELKMLTQEALAVGSVGKYGPIEVADALKTLALAGLDAQEQMTTLKPVLNFATVGEMGLKDAAESLTAISTAFGYTSTGFSAVGDIVAKAAAISMSSVSDMTQAFRQASTVAQQFGVSVTDASVTLALLAQVGIRGSAAGTAMRNMYNELIGSSKQAKKVLQETLGVSIIDNQTKSVKSLSVILGDLAGALSKYSYEAQLNILQAMGNERGTKALSAGLTAMVTKVRESGGNLKTILQSIQEQMSDAPGFVAMASIGMALTAQNQIKSVGNAMQAALIEAFQAAQPSVLVVAAGMRDAFNSKEFKEGLKSLVEGLAAFVGFVVRNIDVFAAIATGLAIGTGAVAAMRLAVAAATVVLPPLGVAIGALAAGSIPSLAALAVAFWPVTLAIAAVGAAWWLLSDSAAEAGKKVVESGKASLDATMKGLDAEAARLREQMRLRQEGTTQEVLAAATRMELARQDMMTMHQQARANQDLERNRLMAARAGLGESGVDVAKAADIERRLARLRGPKADLVLAQVKTEKEFDDKVREVKNLAVADAKQAAEFAKRSRDTPTGAKSFSPYGSSGSAAAINPAREANKALTSQIRLLKIEQDNADRAFANTDAISKRNDAMRGFSTELEDATRYTAALAKAESQYVIDRLEAGKAAQSVLLDPKATEDARDTARETFDATVAELGVKKMLAGVTAQIALDDAARGRSLKLAADAAAQSKTVRSGVEAAYQDELKLGELREALSFAGKSRNAEELAALSRMNEVRDANHEFEVARIEAETILQENLARIRAQGEGGDIGYASSQAGLSYLNTMNEAKRKRDATLGATGARSEAAAYSASPEGSVSDGIADYLKQVESTAESTRKVVTGAFKDMENALVDFVTTGKLDFDSLATSIVSGITRIIIQQQLIKPMAEFLQGGVSSGSGIGGLISSGVQYLFGGGKASGGPVDPGSFYQVNENGPELLSTGGRTYLMMGTQPGEITPNNKISSGGGGQTVMNTVNNHFTINGPTDRRTQAQISSAAASGAQHAMSRNY